MPTSSGFQMRILTDEVWHSNVLELLRTLFAYLLDFFDFLEFFITNSSNSQLCSR